MVKCRSCRKGVNSIYIRHGAKGLMNKVGLYCSSCDAYYDPRLFYKTLRNDSESDNMQRKKPR